MMHAAEVIGIIGIINYTPDEGGRGFYAKWAFRIYPMIPRHAVIVRIRDL